MRGMRPLLQREGAGSQLSACRCVPGARRLSARCGVSHTCVLVVADVLKPIYDKFLGKKSMWCHQVRQDGAMGTTAAEREGKTFSSDDEVGFRARCAGAGPRIFYLNKRVLPLPFAACVVPLAACGLLCRLLCWVPVAAGTDLGVLGEGRVQMRRPLRWLHHVLSADLLRRSGRARPR